MPGLGGDPYLKPIDLDHLDAGRGDGIQQDLSHLGGLFWCGKSSTALHAALPFGRLRKTHWEIHHDTTHCRNYRLLVALCARPAGCADFSYRIAGHPRCTVHRRDDVHLPERLPSLAVRAGVTHRRKKAARRLMPVS